MQIELETLIRNVVAWLLTMSADRRRGAASPTAADTIENPERGEGGDR